MGWYGMIWDDMGLSGNWVPPQCDAKYHMICPIEMVIWRGYPQFSEKSNGNNDLLVQSSLYRNSIITGDNGTFRRLGALCNCRVLNKFNVPANMYCTPKISFQHTQQFYVCQNGFVLAWFFWRELFYNYKDGADSISNVLGYVQWSSFLGTVDCPFWSRAINPF